VLAIRCPRCNGLDRECERCRGTGEAILFRCPTSHNSAELSAAFFAYALVETGVWPASGGLLDQSASFVGFVREVNAERAEIERAKEQVARARESSAASKQRR